MYFHVPSIDEIEKKILEIFSQFRIRPNESLPVRSITSAWIKTGFNNEELADGLESLLKKGFIVDTGKQAFRLWGYSGDIVPNSRLCQQ